MADALYLVFVGVGCLLALVVVAASWALWLWDGIQRRGEAAARTTAEHGYAGRSWGEHELQPGQAGWTCSTCAFYDGAMGAFYDGPMGADLDGDDVGQCRFHPPPDRSEVSARDFCAYHVELVVRGRR